MNSVNNNSKVLLFDKKIGIITLTEVVLEERNKQKKIELSSINKVSLSKHRAYSGNAIVFILGIFIAINTHVFFRDNKSSVYFGFLTMALITILFSVFYKFYFYKIDFKKKKEVIYSYQASQLQRDNIKAFYNCLKSILKEKVA